MIDVFHAIHACADLVHYWDVARRGDGVVLHATSRGVFSTRQEAERVAGEIAARVQPEGYDVQGVDLRAREGEMAGGWRAFVEVALS
jgi:hypothetical protein